MRDCGVTWVSELGASKYKLILVVGSTVTVQEEKGRRRCPFFCFCPRSHSRVKRHLTKLILCYLFCVLGIGVKYDNTAPLSIRSADSVRTRYKFLYGGRSETVRLEGTDVKVDHLFQAYTGNLGMGVMIAVNVWPLNTWPLFLCKPHFVQGRVEVHVQGKHFGVCLILSDLFRGEGVAKNWKHDSSISTSSDDKSDLK